ncbi:MAG: hypothetical protein AVDCRST_MAG42-2526 [uncultured Chthoniobacterales bacterium]|uniref:Lipocalin-like domain-containing protein n=1 Tax=uncultured Chthoniobacterales bacterium TaxID=1836801 RepID=A0A6J4IRF9_9BACT|nr:MAG: hypothetical protein AVDCRST_MAG42-2526 [uncultured Chthoniobacterales bacterium]
MKKFFGFGSSTPPPPPPPSKPPSPPVAKPAPAAKVDAPAAPAKPEPPKTQPAPAATAPAPSIVGRWKDPNSGDITEFHADGAVTENVSGSEPIRGRYSLTDGKLKLNLDGVPDELSFPVTVKADTLDMIDPDGHMTRYQRQK